MRITIFRVTNDDHSDYRYPRAVSLAQIRDADDLEVVRWSERAHVSESVTFDADPVQYTITRIR